MAGARRARWAGVPSLTILEKQHQRWGSFVALRFFVTLPVRMPGTDMEIGMREWQPAGSSGCGRGRVRRPCPILYAGSEALRPPAGDGWSPRPPAASNLGERPGETGAPKSVNRSEHEGPDSEFPIQPPGSKEQGTGNTPALRVIVRIRARARSRARYRCRTRNETNHPPGVRLGEGRVDQRQSAAAGTGTTTGVRGRWQHR